MTKYFIIPIVSLFLACSNNSKNSETQTSQNQEADTLEASKKDSCFCDSDLNLNLISDSAMSARKTLWMNKLKVLYPAIPPDSLPQGFQISIEDIKALAELLNKKKYPTPKSVMAYFTFDDQEAADKGRITAVMVPIYTNPFPPCKSCKKGATETLQQSSSQTINLDLTQPCPPFCESPK